MPILGSSKIKLQFNFWEPDMSHLFLAIIDDFSSFCNLKDRLDYTQL